ncbi:MAG: 3-deoxy-D-manno-octulosonic acid transferase [Desulfuromonadaceae bacterium]|nr:3-deoxy-D-manno-octulosonic acid transferase [Desulfuromonadaceae bacterium]
MYLLYNILLLLLALPVLAGHLLHGLLRGRRRQGVRERFGCFAHERLAPLSGKKTVWVHAVSVGETQAAAPLIKALKSRYPDWAVVLTNVTETGHRVAKGISEVDLCLYFPYDFSWTVRRVFAQLKPALVVVVETEIWPNFMRVAHRSGVPSVLVNGRISDRSFPRYRRLSFFIKPVLRQFSIFCMQSDVDAQRIEAMGAPADRIEVTRNLKFDMQTGGLNEQNSAPIRRKYGIPACSKVLVAGSTHIGEEEQVLDVYRRLLKSQPDLCLILVPRHPDRCRLVGELLSSRDVLYSLRSEIEGIPITMAPGAVLLVDTVGELLQFYTVADLIFVGGSLVPVGGHNILEAALLKKPVLFGPHMHNFKEISHLLVQAGGGLVISEGEEFYREANNLLSDSQRCQDMGAKGYALLQDNRGATKRTLQAIERIMEAG